jgi:hypothetical protein
VLLNNQLYTVYSFEKQKLNKCVDTHGAFLIPKTWSCARRGQNLCPLVPRYGMDTEPDLGVRPQTKAQKSRCQKARWVIMSCRRPQLFGQRIQRGFPGRKTATDRRGTNGHIWS